MPRILAVRAAILIGFLVTTGNTADLPNFAAYATRKTFRGKPAKPLLGNSADRRFQEAVLADTERGPTFAGHYTLVAWTCGTGCTHAIVVDAATGTLYHKMPFEMLLRAGLERKQEPYSFRRDSRLLIVQGYFDIEFANKDSECSRRYYEWTGRAFRLLRKAVLMCTPTP